MASRTSNLAKGRSPFEHAYALIMAGGSGTRFWPLSRRKHPKQLLTVFGEKSLLEQTVARIQSVIPPERVFVFTSEDVHASIVRLLPQVPANQIVAEPAGRNTAPTIGMGAHEVIRRDPDGLMVVLPSDHVIRKTEPFLRALGAACEWAACEDLSVVLGITPTRPDTGYGYIRFGEAVGTSAGQVVHRIEKFTEKPQAQVARRYIASGRYSWNSGMFIWRASTLLANLKKYKPQMSRLLEQISRAGGVRNVRVFRRIFPRLEKISIDYALMQDIQDVYGIAMDVGWSDVGSWAVAYELSPKDKNANAQPKETVSIDSTGNLIVAARKTVATVGVRDLIIVETDDGLLVTSREQAQKVGKVVEALQTQGREDLL